MGRSRLCGRMILAHGYGDRGRLYERTLRLLLERQEHGRQLHGRRDSDSVLQCCHCICLLLQKCMIRFACGCISVIGECLWVTVSGRSAPWCWDRLRLLDSRGRRNLLDRIVGRFRHADPSSLHDRCIRSWINGVNDILATVYSISMPAAWIRQPKKRMVAFPNRGFRTTNQLTTDNG